MELKGEYISYTVAVIAAKSFHSKKGVHIVILSSIYINSLSSDIQQQQKKFPQCQE